jgi:hypothetical protein
MEGWMEGTKDLYGIWILLCGEERGRVRWGFLFGCPTWWVLPFAGKRGQSNLYEVLLVGIDLEKGSWHEARNTRDVT